MRAILLHLFGASFNDDMLSSALRARGRDLGDSIQEEARTWVDPDLNMPDDSPMDDLADVQEQLRVIKVRRDAAQKLERDRLAAAAAIARDARVDGAGSSGDGAPPPDALAVAPERRVRVRRWVPAVADGLSVAEALEFAPPLAKMTKDSIRENRWRIRAPYMNERSKSFGRGSGLSDWAAMTFLLRLAWRRYTEVYGVECPFQLDD
jgi:hypothetical protein